MFEFFVTMDFTRLLHQLWQKYWSFTFQLQQLFHALLEQPVLFTLYLCSVSGFAPRRFRGQLAPGASFSPESFYLRSATLTTLPSYFLEWNFFLAVSFSLQQLQFSTRVQAQLLF